MKNKEKYFNEICRAIYDMNFDSCDFIKKYISREKQCKGMACSRYRQETKEWLEQEYKPPITLTDDEKTILKNVDKQYEWIARQKSGGLILYKDNPIKSEALGNWLNTEEFSFFQHFNHLFQFIKWEDDEPCNIDDLLKRNGVER